MVATKGPLGRREWLHVLEKHDHHWTIKASNFECDCYLYECGCGLRYTEEPGLVTHLAPDGTVLRRI